MIGSLSYDPNRQWNHAEKLLLSIKTQNTLENNFGMMRHLGSLAMASHPRKRNDQERKVIYKDWHKPLKLCKLSTQFAFVLILSQFLWGKKGDIILHLSSEYIES